MRSDKKTPLKSDKKSAPKIQKKGTLGYNKKSALLEDAITQMNAGKYGRASSALKELLALDPLNAEARRLFATLHLRLGSLMSARTAFESLAREAMERQDYWLAESLLREYLTAGPRCVPFLEMLGHVYEEKGDVMAAVAEYGKAVEVLLEDPDSEHPNRAGELFGKIRSIAPGSPVAFRFAAMFDTVTGQILQTPPQPGATVTPSESVPMTAISQSIVEPPAAVIMPWEQMEALPTDPKRSEDVQAPTTGDSTETQDAPVSLASVEHVTAIVEPANVRDSASPIQVDEPPPLSEVQLAQVFSSISAESLIGPDEVGSRSEAAVIDSALPTRTVPQDEKPAIELLTGESKQPIAAKPMSPVSMPWDQVQDEAPVISPMVVNECLETANVEDRGVAEADLSALSLVEIQARTVQVTDETSRLSLAESTAGPDPLPVQHDSGVLPVSSPETDGPKATVAEGMFIISDEFNLTVPPSLESTSPTIEVLKTSSADPITESVSPAPMPWDQVEEMTGASLSTVQTQWAAEVEPMPQPATTIPIENAEPTTESPVAPSSPFTSSLGLSWEDILAAVTAMQSSPAIPPAETITGREGTSDSVVPDEKGIAGTPYQDSSETDWFAVASQSSDTVGSLADSPPSLSAPMPWEQIEVEDLAILRPDPEPEFGPVSADAAAGSQDSTVVLPVAEDIRDAESVLPPPGAEVVRDGLTHVDVPSMSEFRILPADAPVDPPEQPLSIHIPLEAFQPVESVEEPGVVAGSEPAAVAASTFDLPQEESLRLGSEAGAAGDEPKPVAPESPAEMAEAVSVETPLTSDQPIVESVEAPLVELTEAMLPNTSSPVDHLLAAHAGRGPIDVIASDPGGESAVHSVVPSFIPDQPVLHTETIAVVSKVMPVADAVETTSMTELSQLSAPGPGPVPELAGGYAPIPVSRKSDVPVERVPPESALAALEKSQGPSIAAPGIVGSDELNLPLIESVSSEVAVPAAGSVDSPAASAVTQAPVSMAASDASAGIHILWDDSSSKPIPSTSIGNMLTRWLKKPADVTPAESSHSTRIAGQSEPPVTQPPYQQEDGAAGRADCLIDRSVDLTPPQVEQHATRPKQNVPVMGRASRRLSRAITSLIGAGVSKTRSLVVMVVAFLGLTAAMLAACVGIIALTWLFLEEQPTSAFRTMTSVPQPTLPDSRKNGYFLLLGFGAGPTQDPVQAGIDRRAEEADRAVTLTCVTGQGNGSGSQQGASAEIAGKWMKLPDPAAQMRAETTGVKSWVSQAGVAVVRYRQWLSKPFEDVGFGQPVSPNCGVVLYAHRLYVAEGFAQDVEAGVARLETDLTAWRTVFGQARTMPVKMLAGDALNDDIAIVSGLLLRSDLDDRLISRLAKLARPLDQSEQSIRWPMQSQFVLATKTLDEAMSHDPADTRPFYGSVAAALPLPKQRRFNAYAEYYEAVGNAAAEGRYADLPRQSQFVRTPPYGLVDVFVNPIESLVGIEPLPTWETFAGRVLETDARLRLASLQAWLRRTSPEQDLLTRVAKAGQGLYDPFTGYPMLVNMKKGVFYSVGRDMKDNEARERFDVVVQIPPSAWAGGKRTADLTDRK